MKNSDNKIENILNSDEFQKGLNKKIKEIKNPPTQSEKAFLVKDLTKEQFEESLNKFDGMALYQVCTDDIPGVQLLDYEVYLTYLIRSSHYLLQKIDQIRKEESALREN